MCISHESFGKTYPRKNRWRHLQKTGGWANAGERPSLLHEWVWPVDPFSVKLRSNDSSCLRTWVISDGADFWWAHSSEVFALSLKSSEWRMTSLLFISGRGIIMEALREPSSEAVVACWKHHKIHSSQLIRTSFRKGGDVATLITVANCNLEEILFSGVQSIDSGNLSSLRNFSSPTRFNDSVSMTRVGFCGNYHSKSTDSRFHEFLQLREVLRSNSV